MYESSGAELAVYGLLIYLGPLAGLALILYGARSKRKTVLMAGVLLLVLAVSYVLLLATGFR